MNKRSTDLVINVKDLDLEGLEGSLPTIYTDDGFDTNVTFNVLGDTKISRQPSINTVPTIDIPNIVINNTKIAATINFPFILFIIICYIFFKSF